MVRPRIHRLLFSFLALSACSIGTPSPAPPTADGTWDFTMSSPFGAVNAVVTLNTLGDSLSGTFDLGNGRFWPIVHPINGDDETKHGRFDEARGDIVEL